MDTVSTETRSKVMARVRSQRNRSTEWRVRGALIASGVRGWKVNAPDIRGRPDFAFPTEKLLIFVDGCFWHGCPKCKRIPNSNKAYWRSKIGRNRERDKAITAHLRREGWQIIRIWEHQLKSTEFLLRRIEDCLAGSTMK